MRHTVTRDAEGWLATYDGVQVIRVTQISKAVTVDDWYCINIKGCNGSGKSTIIFELMHSPYVYFVISKDSKKPDGMFFPHNTYPTAVVGTYTTQCGGCDSVGDTQQVKQILVWLWKRQVHIIYEGVIVGDIKSTFYEIMKEFNTKFKRKLSFCFMGTKLPECYRRIESRNGGKDFNRDQVKQKYMNSLVHLKYYLEQGDVDCKVLDTNGTPAEVFNRFLIEYPLIDVVPF